MQNIANIIWFVIILVLVGLGIFLYFKFTKRLKISNVYFISGAVKTGKTFVSVALAVKKYKQMLFSYRVKYGFWWLVYWITFKKFDKFSCLEKPMLYSNIKLRNIKHNPFTKEILLRQVRIPHKSVVLIDETSLVADSMLFKDKNINDNLLLFFKLFGHYSYGGYCICNSQQVADNHYSLRRAMGRYLYVYNRLKVPFITIVKGVELINCEDNQNVTSMLTGDLEDNTKTLLLWNRYYKYYDCYCYSVFTDDLTLQVDYDRPIYTTRDSLKTDNLVTLQDFSNLDKRFIKENEE